MDMSSRQKDNSLSFQRQKTQNMDEYELFSFTTNKEREPVRIRARLFEPPQLDEEEMKMKKERNDRLLGKHNTSSEQRQEEEKRRVSDFKDIFRSGKHSEKIHIKEQSQNVDGMPQFAVKVVYKNGKGYKPKKWMGIRYIYSFSMINGKEIGQFYGINSPSTYIMNDRLPEIFEMLAENTSEGEIGRLFLTPKHGYGDEGNFPHIPPFSSLQIKYEIITLRFNDYWEEDEKDANDWIEDIAKKVNDFVDHIIKIKKQVRKQNKFQRRGFRQEKKKEKEKKGEKQQEEQQREQEEPESQMEQTQSDEDRISQEKITMEEKIEEVKHKEQRQVFNFLRYKEQLYYNLYLVKKAEDYLSFAMKPISDTFRLQICMLEAYLLYFIGMKISAVRCLDKFYQIKDYEGDYKSEEGVLNLRFILNEELGLWGRMEEDCYFIRKNQELRKMFGRNLSKSEELLKKWDERPEEEKEKLREQYDQKWNKWLLQQKQVKPYQNWIYCPFGYRPNDNKLEEYPLNQKIDEDNMLKWVFGDKELEYYLMKIQEGEKKRPQYKQELVYLQQKKAFNEREEKNKIFCAQNSITFQWGFFVHKNKNESWEEFYTRRNKEILAYRLKYPERQIGQSFQEWERRKKRPKKIIPYEIKLKDRLKKINPSIVKLPEEKAFKIFQIYDNEQRFQNY